MYQITIVLTVIFVSKPCQSFSGPWAGRNETEGMSSVHGPLMGWILRAMGCPGSKNLGLCHLCTEDKKTVLAICPAWYSTLMIGFKETVHAWCYH